MAKRESANESGEKYQKGRTAGVEGTHGTARKGVAEKTVIGSGDQSEGGTLDGALSGAASSIYSKAVKNGGGSDTGGDPALRER
jgi:hypothetical protein